MSDLTSIFVEALKPSCLRLYCHWIECDACFAEELMAPNAPIALTTGGKYPKSLQFDLGRTSGYLFHSFPSHLIINPSCLAALNNFEIPAGVVEYFQQVVRENVILPPILIEAHNTRCYAVTERLGRALQGKSLTLLRRIYRPSIIYLTRDTHVWERFWTI